MDSGIPQVWFEMPDLRRRFFANAVWVPLRASDTIETPMGGRETFAVGCVAFPPSKRPEAEKLGWMDIGIRNDGGPYAFRDGRYKPCEVFQYQDGEDLGVDLVFNQHVGAGHPSIWHLNQDMVLALKLLQEGDVWVCPDEGYVEAVRQRRSADGRVTSIEIRNDFLRDYLAARSLVLRLAYYRQRVATLADMSHIVWPSRRLSEEKAHDRFETRITEVDSTGFPHGASTAIFHAWRTDVDPDDDVPVFGSESDDNTAHRSTTFTRGGQKFYRIEGELWREEWIEPAELSERVRGDNATDTVSFIVDASGSRASGAVLNNEDIGRYLWFDPRIIPALAGRRGGGLRWYTADTGAVWCSPDWSVHFGINRLGLITAYAYDVAKLPSWQQRIWAGHNMAPDGAVSSELLEAQMKASPARTRAPEADLPEAMRHLDEAAQNWLGAPIFHKHDATAEIMSNIHRFRAIEQGGILALAKDLSRLIVDQIDIGTLRKVATPPAGERWGSLKSFEKALESLVKQELARKLLTPLVGLYELRLGDAHLPSDKIKEAFAMLNLDPSSKPIDLGRDLLTKVIHTLRAIRFAINHPTQRAEGSS